MQIGLMVGAVPSSSVCSRRMLGGIVVPFGLLVPFVHLFAGGTPLIISC